MEIHHLKATGSVTLDRPATEPEHAVRFDQLQQASASNPIYVTGVEAIGGNVGSLTHLPDTVPASAIVLSAVTDVPTIRVHFKAFSSNAFIKPSVRVGSVAASVDSGPESRMFVGHIDITIDEDTERVVLTSSEGTTAVLEIRLSLDVPEFLDFVASSYPAPQTTLKNGDTILISGVVSDDAHTLELNSDSIFDVDYEFGPDSGHEPGYKVFTGTLTLVSATSNQHRFSAKVRNELGSPSNELFTDLYDVDNTVPVIGPIAFTYPVGQEAAAVLDDVGFNVSVTGATSVTFSSTVGTIDADAQTLSIGHEYYSLGQNNFTVLAHKTSNGTTVTRQGAIDITPTANVYTIGIQGASAGVRTSVEGALYTVVISTANQAVHTTYAPQVDTSAGQWEGQWVRVGQNWTRQIRFFDTDARGTHSFSNFSIKNKALIETNDFNNSSTYVVSGFTKRNVVLAPFAQFTAIGTTVHSNADVRVTYAGSESLLTYRNNTGVAQASFTIVDQNGVFAAQNGTHVFINDVDFANSNTSGTLQLTVEEL